MLYGLFALCVYAYCEDMSYMCLRLDEISKDLGRKQDEFGWEPMISIVLEF